MGEITRRLFLKLTGIGGAAAMAGGLGKKAADKLIPYMIPPDDGIRPGVFSTYVTTCRECPAGCGMHARFVDGRVCKVEGNPLHPVNRGALCPRGQSAVQGLYDPDRLTGPLHRLRAGGAADSVEWEAALSAIAAKVKVPGARAFVVSDLQTGALYWLMRGFAESFGSELPLIYEPLHHSSMRQAHEKSANVLIPQYQLEKADFIMSFGADFLETWLSPVEYARGFTESRSYRDGKMGRFVYVGPRLSMTAANADEFIQVQPGQELTLARALILAILRRGRQYEEASIIPRALKEYFGKIDPKSLPVPQEKIDQLAKAIINANSAVFLPGPAGVSSQYAMYLAACAMMLNQLSGSDRNGAVNLRRTHALSWGHGPEETEKALAEMTAKDVLIIHNANIAYSAPRLKDGLTKAETVVYLGTMPDETAELADWVLPIDSPLEAWGDYEPYFGLHSLQQPAMQRLHNTCQAGDVFLMLARACEKKITDAAHVFGEPDKPNADTFEEFLRYRWEGLHKKNVPDQPFEEFWEECLRRGGLFVQGGPTEPGFGVPDQPKDWTALAPAANQDSKELNLWLWASPMYGDGRVSNRGWLLEAPDPTSNIVWNSWADLHPETAAKLGLIEGDVVRVQKDGQGSSHSIEVAIRVTTDVVPGTLAVMIGQGHTALGRDAKGRRANAFALLSGNSAQTLADASGSTTNASSSAEVSSPTAPLPSRLAGGLPFGVVHIEKTGRRQELVYTAPTQDQHDRHLLQWMPLSKLREMKPEQADKLILPLAEGYREGEDLYEGREYKNHRWGMAIDLHKCIGCGACAVACYAENNISVVGPLQVSKGREMAWLKLATYREGEPHEQGTGHSPPQRLGWLPMLCQQCDAAPCEPVCPVFAAVHNEEGLNSQIYNRCIGTRYCNNNCPYKVRRFNWLDYPRAKSLEWQLNPYVGVRCRGVMEKCTFCVQRIRGAEQQARVEGRALKDGEFTTACAQTCPTGAIVFGDLLDPNSRVAQLTGCRGNAGDIRRYHVLEELNTKPAITYLRRVWNDLPEGKE